MSTSCLIDVGVTKVLMIPMLTVMLSWYTGMLSVCLSSTLAQV
ncbi:hypothetical protein ACODM8_05105 [Vibrio ostreicida]|uniref:Uncharacterized protein n=1 Tax=Vibrio ostreicida TaxID=526588 RepID=A0ABT8BZ11_9VIBR|nr:hypothetical protein [Vibrio ostreicida]MDN3611584.1 hypothetical protein [Vibrio ostreicida]